MQRFTAAILLLILPLGACHSWSLRDFPERTDPRALATDTIPEVKVHRVDGPPLTMYRAVVDADSVAGFSRPPDQDGARWLALSREEVERLEVRRFSLGETGLLVGGVAVAAFVVFAVACSASDCFDFGWSVQ